jgi:hypothetical protein
MRIFAQVYDENVPHNRVYEKKLLNAKQSRVNFLTYCELEQTGALNSSLVQYGSHTSSIFGFHSSIFGLSRSRGETEWPNLPADIR